MSQLIELNEADDELELSFPFNRELKDFVKSLPRSRFDWNSKTWRFPVDAAASVIPVLTARGFVTSDKVKPLLGDDAGPPTTSVRQLNRAISTAINRGIPGPFWLAGELANWTRNAHRRHAYFELLDTNAIGRAEAMIGAVMFGGARERIEAKVRKGGLQLTDGLGVRLLVRVELYEERGKVQVIVEDIDVAYSAGELAMRKEEILRALQEKGVADRQLRREMPLLPRRIALLTSAQSDAYHDFVHTLERARYGFEIVPFDVRVQGADLEETVTNALRAIERSSGRFDLVVITRGGGSRTELASWDSLRVAYAVCASRTKIVVAIGHQQDRSVLDEVATSFKTPTEAAERIVERWTQAEARVDALSGRVSRRVRSRVAVERERVENRVLRLSAASARTTAAATVEVNTELPRLIATITSQELRSARRNLDRTSDRLERVATHTGAARRADRLSELEQRITAAVTTSQRSGEARLDRLGAAIERASTAQVRRSTSALRSIASQLSLADPSRILRRGFAIVRRDGEFVTAAGQALPNDALTLTMADGTIEVSVSTVSTNPKEKPDG